VAVKKKKNSTTRTKRRRQQHGYDREFLDAFCARLVRPDYLANALPAKIMGPGDLIDHYGAVASRLLSDMEWEDVSQRVMDWQQAKSERVIPKIDSCSALQIILGKHARFPPVRKVEDVLGQEAAATYRANLEDIDNNPRVSVFFPDERPLTRWNADSVSRAAGLVAEVLAPYAGDNDELLLRQRYKNFSAAAKNE
jgi:hypothetical protein